VHLVGFYYKKVSRCTDLWMFTLFSRSPWINGFVSTRYRGFFSTWRKMPFGCAWYNGSHFTSFRRLCKKIKTAGVIPLPPVFPNHHHTQFASLKKWIVDRIALRTSGKDGFALWNNWRLTFSTSLLMSYFPTSGPRTGVRQCFLISQQYVILPNNNLL